MKRIQSFIKNVGQRTEGYLTIEVTMVFSVLFFSLILIMLMGMVLYQEVNLQSLAVRASERGAVVYSSRVADMYTGVKTLEDFTIRDPYRNVPFMDQGKKEEYRSLLNSYVAGNLGRNDVLSGTVENAGNYVAVEDYLISKKIRVSIQSSYGLPMASLGKMFGQEGSFEVSTTAVSAVVDASDFVRNVDLATDVAKCTSFFGNVQHGYNEIRQALNKLTDLLN